MYVCMHMTSPILCMHVCMYAHTYIHAHILWVLMCAFTHTMGLNSTLCRGTLVVVPIPHKDANRDSEGKPLAVDLKVTAGYARLQVTSVCVGGVCVYGCVCVCVCVCAGYARLQVTSVCVGGVCLCVCVSVSVCVQWFIV